MPYCIYCGKLNSDGNKFCTSCGKPLEQDSSREGSAPAATPAPETPHVPAVRTDPPAAEKARPTAPVEVSVPSASKDETVRMPVPAPAPSPEPIAPRQQAGTEPDPLEYHPDPTSTYSAPAGAGTTQRIQMPTPATATMPSPVTSQAGQYAPTASQAGQTAPKKANAVLYGIIIALVAVIIALVVIFVVKPFGDSNQAEPTKTEQSASAKKSSEIKEPEVKGDPNNPDDDGTAAKETKTDTAEQNIYSELNTYYGKLSGYDQQVRDAASAFNSEYLKSDMSSRRTTAAAAESLEEELDDLKDEVENLNVPVSSQNYASWRSIIVLYDDLCNRIEVICDAWEVSLEYADPTAHQDEIVAPLARDNVAGTNDNKYRLDYEDRYAGAAPVEVK